MKAIRTFTCFPCHFFPSTSICICVCPVCTWTNYLCSCLALTTPISSHVVRIALQQFFSFSHTIFHKLQNLFSLAFNSMLFYISKRKIKKFSSSPPPLLTLISLLFILAKIKVQFTLSDFNCSSLFERESEILFIQVLLLPPHENCSSQSHQVTSTFLNPKEKFSVFDRI